MVDNELTSPQGGPGGAHESPAGAAKPKAPEGLEGSPPGLEHTASDVGTKPSYEQALEQALGEALLSAEPPLEQVHERGLEAFWSWSYDPDLEVLECVVDSETDLSVPLLYRHNRVARLLVFEDSRCRVQLELEEAGSLAGERTLSLGGHIEGFSGLVTLERVGSPGSVRLELHASGQGDFEVSGLGEAPGGRREHWRLLWQDSSGARVATTWFIP